MLHHYILRVMNISDYVTINEREYSLEILGLVTGKLGIDVNNTTVKQEYLILCEVLDNPYRLPYLLETYYLMKIVDEQSFRFSLMRVQVDSDLRMHEDIQKHQQRSYVVRTIEKLLYGDLMLETVKALDFDIDDFE